MKSPKKRWLRKGLKITLVMLLIAGLSLVGFTIYTVRRSFPIESGAIALPKIQAEVTIWRDKWGVPHIWADNSHDLFMAQGYIHAQDRFWQMDFWRHIGSGRLAEMFGSSQVETDRYLRTMNWAGIAQQEIQQMDAQMKSNLQAYAEGVNAYLAKHQGSALSLEYAVLKFLNPGYKPEPWQLLNSSSMRMIVDLGNLDNSLAIHTPGQSGHTFHRHYTDMIDPWRKIEYHPMLWKQQTNNVAKLRLIPQ